MIREKETMTVKELHRDCVLPSTNDGEKTQGMSYLGNGDVHRILSVHFELFALCSKIK